MSFKAVFFTAIMSVTYAPNSLAQDADIKNGKALSQYCMGCHGVDGIAPYPNNPNLAGQNAKYLEYALKAYRDGERRGGMAVIMRNNAGSLTDKEIKDLAAFYASLPGRNVQN